MCGDIYIPRLLYPFVHQGHLGCFYVLVVVNNAAVNRGCRYISEILISFPLGMNILEVGFLDHIGLCRWGKLGAVGQSAQNSL